MQSGTRGWRSAGAAARERDRVGAVALLHAGLESVWCRGPAATELPELPYAGEGLDMAAPGLGAGGEVTGWRRSGLGAGGEVTGWQRSGLGVGGEVTGWRRSGLLLVPFPCRELRAWSLLRLLCSG